MGLQSHVTNTPLTAQPYGSKLKQPSRVRIHQCFLDADLRFALPGLLDLCAKHDIDVSELPPGNLIVFVNTAKDMIKVVACNGTIFPVLSTYRIPNGSSRGQFDLNIVAEIPKAYMVKGKLDIQEAMMNVLEKKLGRVH